LEQAPQNNGIFSIAKKNNLSNPLEIATLRLLACSQ